MEYMMKLKTTLNIFQMLLRRQNSFCITRPMSNALYLNFKSPYLKAPLVVPSLFTIPIRFKKAQGKMPKGGKSKIVQLTDAEMSEVIDIEEYRDQLHNIEETLKKDYVENLSLRSSSNIENLIVEVEGQEYPLHELAQISRKNPTLIAINMTDFPEAIKPVIQAIINSGSGLNPQQEGTMIYLTIAKLTREHRENLAKNAKTLFVKAKDEVRSVQNFFIKDAKRKTDLSEDLTFNASNLIKNIAEQAVENLEKTLKSKQKELLGES